MVLKAVPMFSGASRVVSIPLVIKAIKLSISTPAEAAAGATLLSAIAISCADAAALAPSAANRSIIRVDSVAAKLKPLIAEVKKFAASLTLIAAIRANLAAVTVNCKASSASRP